MDANKHDSLLRPRFGRRRGIASYKYYGGFAKRGAAWFFLQDGVAELMRIPAMIIMARLLSPYEFGVAAGANFFIQLANRMTALGFSASLVRMKTVRQDHASSVFAVTLSVGILTWLAMSLSADRLGAFFNSSEIPSVLRVSAIAFVIGPLAAVPSALMSRELLFRERTVLVWVASLIHLTLSIGLAWSGFSYWSLVYAELARTAVYAVGMHLVSGWPISVRCSLSALREMFSFGSAIYIKRLLDYSGNNLDNLVVGRLLGLTALGFYDKAFTAVSRIAGRLSTAGPGVAFRILSMIHEDRDRFIAAYRKIVLSVTMLAYPILTIGILTAPELFSVMFGERWVPAAAPFQLLCVAGMLRMQMDFASSALQAKGWVWQEVLRQVAYLGLVIGGVIVGSRWGITGAAGGVLVATTVKWFLMHRLISRGWKVSWIDLLSPHIPALCCVLGLVPTLVLSDMVLRPQLEAPWILLVVKAGLGTTFFLAYLLWSRFVELRAVVHDTLAEFIPSLAWIAPPLAGTVKDRKDLGTA